MAASDLSFLTFNIGNPSEQRAQRQLSLPMHPHLSEQDARFIAGVVTDALVTEAV